MATRASISVQRDLCGFRSVLASAVLEWLLIFLLLLNALFSYMVTKFARFFGMEIPCLFCSRLDHILGGEQPGFYRNLICRAHKLEISSLVYCCAHEKLSNAHGMCEACCLPFATNKKSNSATCRSSVGKLGADLECGNSHKRNIHLNLPDLAIRDGMLSQFDGDLVKDPLLKDSVFGSAVTRHCSCCNEPLRSNPCMSQLVQIKQGGLEISELDGPLSGVTGHSSPVTQHLWMKRRQKSCGSAMTCSTGNHKFDPLSHIGYTELNITSDSESEAAILDDDDDDDGSALVPETGVPRDEFFDQCLQPESGSVDKDLGIKTLSVDSTMEKLIHQALVPEPLLPVSHGQLDLDERHEVSSLASAFAVGQGLEEVNWDPVDERSNPPATSEPILPHDPPPSVNLTDAPVGLSEDKLNVTEFSDAARLSSAESPEIIKMESGTALTESLPKTAQTINEPGKLVPNCMDLNEAYRLAVGNNGSLPQVAFVEMLTGKDSSRVHEDLKLLVSQISAAHGFDFIWNDASKANHVHGDDSKTSDTSSSIGMQILQKRLSRNESGFESLDGSVVSEIEGESEVDRLKRQIELDHKTMKALYKELEEERSASAIAANEAMAMINKLHEEKAAMQMEALHYQRMMEEQAEYDQEAVQQLNDLLNQKEKEMQDLEADLENYRRRFENELFAGQILTVSELNGKERTAGCPRLHSDAITHDASFAARGLHGDSNFNQTDSVNGDCGRSKTGALKDSLFSSGEAYQNQISILDDPILGKRMKSLLHPQ